MNGKVRRKEAMIFEQKMIKTKMMMKMKKKRRR